MMWKVAGMDDCLFCKIARKEIPATVVFEDAELMAFKDIFPQAPVHLLIIPKAHCEGLNDLRPEFAAVLGRAPFVAAALAKAAGVAESGWRLVSKVGEDGGQSVFHLHFHLLGGKPLGGKMCS